MEHPELRYGASSSTRVPKLLRWKCVNNLCNDCETEKNLAISKCPTLCECVIQIDVLEWVHEKRQDINKRTGKSNNQLNLGHTKLPSKEVLKELIVQLQKCIITRRNMSGGT